MNAELKSKVEIATTPVSLVGLIPDFAGSEEEDITILYDQVKKVAVNIDNYADASILISNFILSPRIKSVQDYHLRRFLIEQLGHFDSSWK